MVQPLQFSMIMTLDSKGAQQGAREVRQEIASTGQAAKAAGGDLSAMATGMQAEAAAAKQVTQALTGAAGAEAAYRQEVQRRIGLGATSANQNTAGVPLAVPPSGGGGGTGSQGLPPQTQPAMLDQIRERYNPLFKIGQDYKRTLAEIAEAERTAGLTTAEATVYRRQAAEAAERQMLVLNRMPGVYGAVTGASKLTSNQLLNLSRQGNDAATMWLMGADGMQIFVSQAGQVYGALQEGPGGVAGSIKAVGTSLLALATPMNLAIVGFTAAAAAGIYFATRTEKQIKPLNEAMDAHREALKGVAEAYGLALDKADRYAKSVSPGVASFQERQSRAELQLSAQDTLAKSFKPSAFSSDYLRYSPSLGEIGLLETDVAPKYEAFRKPLMALNAELQTGKGDAIAFVEAVATIANQDPANDKLRELAARLIEVAAPAAAAQRQLQAMALSVDAVTRATQKAYRERRDTLESFVPDTRSERQRITEAYQGQMNAAPRLAGSARAAEGLQIDATRQYQRAIDEVERSEENARRSRELDIASISAKTAAQKASIAQQRMAIELNTAEGDKIGETERQRRVAAEGLKVYAEAQREANDALRGANDDLALAGLEGQARELAAINQEVARGIELNPQLTGTWRAYGEARRAALELESRQSLFRPQEEELAKLQAEAAAIGASAAERRRIMTDLQAEQDLRRAGVDLASREADTYRQQARALADYRADIERTGEAWDSFGEAGSNALDKLLDVSLDGSKLITDAFDEIGKDLTRTLFDLSVRNPLQNLLTGGENPTLSDLGGFEGIWGRITGQPIKTPTAPTITLAERGSTPVNPLFVSLVGSTGIPGANTLGGGAAGAVSRLAGGGRGNAFLDLIGRAEGTDRGDGYNETLGYGAFTGGDVNLTSMSLNDVLALQKQMLADPSNPFNSSAVGRYQITSRTLRGLMEQLGLSGSETFDAGMQDRMALTLAGRRGNDVAGLRNEWEGLRGIDPAEIQEAYASLGQTSTALANSASSFQSGFDGALNSQLIGGVTQVADSFVPGLGGVLRQLIDDVGKLGGGGGGGVGQFLGSILGGGGPAAADPWAGLRFDRGGYTGDGQRHAIAGYVHRGEVVWNQDDVKAVGGPAAAEAIRLGVGGGRGYEHGGVVGFNPPVSGTRQGSAGAGAAAAVAPVVQIFDQRRGGEDIEQRESIGPDGERRLEIYVKDKVKQEVTGAGSDTNRALRRGYGVSPGLVAR